jgi:predicted dehydrogenase
MQNKKNAMDKVPNARKKADVDKSDRISDKPRKVRYAVVGLGYFSQMAILPAFLHAGKNSILTALVSDDPEKAAKLAKKYGVEKTYDYDGYNDCLKSGEIDAVYIALPNDLHKDFATRAAKVGIHVLCEKPMAVEERDCEEMIRAANEHHTRLMIAYRLHLDPANLQAVETIKSGKIGEPRIFHGAFTMQVKEGNIRTQNIHGGDNLYDLGIYCINAARYLFQEEPLEAFAFSSKSEDPRFREVDEMTSAILKFPGEKLASFTSSFGAADCGFYQVVGTKGDLRLDQAFDYAFPTKLTVTVGGKKKEKEFAKHDQVGAELLYFSRCIQNGEEPEPSGVEGQADVRIIRALHESAATGKPVAIAPLPALSRKKRPSGDQAMKVPPSKEPDLFHAEPPTQD